MNDEAHHDHAHIADGAENKDDVRDAAADKLADRMFLSGRRARRAYRYGHTWIRPGRQGDEHPERSRCQRKTAKQRRNDRSATAAAARQTKRREQRKATAAEVAA